VYQYIQNDAACREKEFTLIFIDGSLINCEDRRFYAVCINNANFNHAGGDKSSEYI